MHPNKRRDQIGSKQIENIFFCHLCLGKVWLLKMSFQTVNLLLKCSFFVPFLKKERKKEKNEESVLSGTIFCAKQLEAFMPLTSSICTCSVLSACYPAGAQM